MASEPVNKRLILWALALAIAAVAFGWALYLARTVLLILYASVILALGFHPIVSRLERIRLTRKRTSRVPRWMAILVVYTFLLGVLAAVISILVPTFVEQAQALWQSLPAYIDKVETALIRWHLLTRRWTMTELLAKPSADSTMTSVMSALSGIIGGVVGMLSILILAFYMLVDAANIKAGLLRFVDPRRRAEAASLVDDVTGKVSAWLIGQVTVAVVMGATATLALWLFGVPYFYVLGLLVGVGEFVPIVGPIIAGLPAVMVASSISVNKALFVGLYLLVQHLTEANLIVPRFMQYRVGVSAVTIVIALLSGAAILGISGVLLAIPSAAIAQVLIVHYLDRRDARSS